MISSLRVISGALWQRGSFFTPSQGPRRASCFQAKSYRITGTRITYMKLAKGPQGKLKNTREMLQIHVFGIRLRDNSLLRALLLFNSCKRNFRAKFSLGFLPATCMWHVLNFIGYSTFFLHLGLRSYNKISDGRSS